jgi:regulator of protease activity HflC (stomatin/prohibitin superfamily)
MDEQNLLRHLLGVEAEASALVEEAQAEADRRVAEGERQSRSRVDEGYSRRAAELEGDYGQAELAVREDYRRRLEDYRDGLAALGTDQGRFTALVEEFLGKGC